MWIRNDKVKQVTRLNLYRELVKSILLYNCCTWSMTKQEEHKLNTFHRRQLRTILYIKYPRVIKNNALYQKTGETPLSSTIPEARWRLFCHILRQAINTPPIPNVAMTKYFKTEGSKQRGRPKTSIVTTLRRDLKSHNNGHWPTRLHSIKDLDHLHDIAQNRSHWKHLTTAIYRSVQAETSVDVVADGH
ncbi:endonuclease-reverse transcriptase [Elysia marginata]|uniref:Endonuclease-reverse transcriptase n=1 Tax=Elysia marginata TaxID=1093978 RepID=A0AAV4GL55_9GAST|nr:endonuclease-reverse transcriptase [Elysia marginata]